MFGQACLPNEKSSLPLQVEIDHAALSRDVVSQQKTRLLWAALGFAVLTLIVVSACASLPLASHAWYPERPSRDAPTFAFSPILPALAPGGIRSSVVDQPVALAGVRVAHPSWAAPSGDHGEPWGSMVVPDSHPQTAPLLSMSADTEFRPPRRLLEDYSGVMSVNIEQQLTPGKMRDIWIEKEFVEFKMSDAMLQEDGLDGKLDNAQRIYIGSSLPLDEHANSETDSLRPIVMEFRRPFGGWDARYLFDCIEEVDSLQRPHSVWFGGMDCHHIFFEGLTFDEQKGAYLAMWGS